MSSGAGGCLVRYLALGRGGQGEGGPSVERVWVGWFAYSRRTPWLAVCSLEELARPLRGQVGPDVQASGHRRQKACLCSRVRAEGPRTELSRGSVKSGLCLLPSTFPIHTRSPRTDGNLGGRRTRQWRGWLRCPGFVAVPEVGLQGSAVSESSASCRKSQEAGDIANPCPASRETPPQPSGAGPGSQSLAPSQGPQASSSLIPQRK